MSAYLVVKKDGVLIGVWNRSTKIYGSTICVPFEIDTRFDPESQFPKMIDSLNNEIKDYEKEKIKYEKILGTTISYEEKLETLDIISDMEDQISDCEFAITQIQFMLNSYENSKYYDDEDEDKDFTEKNIWTWCIE